MSSIVTCRGKFVWKYGADADDTFLGLDSIPDATGVGRVITVAFDDEKALQTGDIVWRQVDAQSDEVTGQVLIVEPNEIQSIREYLIANRPKSSLWSRIKKARYTPNSLMQLLEAMMQHLSEKESNEFVFMIG